VTLTLGTISILLYASVDPQAASDIWVVPTEGARTPWVFLKTGFDERQGQFSRPRERPPVTQPVINTVLDDGASPIALIQNWTPPSK
jgi:hypothetical protein